MSGAPYESILPAVIAPKQTNIHCMLAFLVTSTTHTVLSFIWHVKKSGQKNKQIRSLEVRKEHYGNSPLRDGVFLNPTFYVECPKEAKV